MSVSCQTMPWSFTAVPGSQFPRLSGSVMVATSLPPEVLPVKGEATEDGEDSSLSMLLPLEQSPLSCKTKKENNQIMNMKSTWQNKILFQDWNSWIWTLIKVKGAPFFHIQSMNSILNECLWRLVSLTIGRQRKGSESVTNLNWSHRVISEVTLIPAEQREKL